MENSFYMYTIYRKKEVILMKNTLVHSFSALFFCCLLTAPSQANTYEITGTNVNYPSQQQIAKYYQDTARDSLSAEVDYATKPQYYPDYVAGVLTEDTQEAALDVVNYVRYIAGLPYNLTLGAQYLEYAQGGAFACAIWGGLSHSPAQGEMSDSFYETAYTGAAASNLGQGYDTLGESITQGWMEDGDSGNIDRIGHRRWILSPVMTQTAFGFTSFQGTYAAMYAFDNAFEETDTTGTIWPAQNMPVDLFGSNFPWSYTADMVASSSDIAVKLTRLNDGKVWTFDQGDTDKSGKYCAVALSSSSIIGQLFSSTVIFRPDPSDISYSAGDVFHVEISGAVSASYCVSFFDVANTTATTGTLTPSSTPSTFTYEEQATEVTVNINASNLSLAVGDSLQVTATVTPTDLAEDLVWSVSDSSKLTVDQKGNVYGKSQGTAVLTATVGDVQDSITVTIKSTTDTVPVESISLSSSTLSLASGQTHQLTASLNPSNATEQTVSWYSKSPEVVTVDSNGKLTALSQGTAQIYAMAGGQQALCTVTVTEGATVTGISLNRSSLSLSMGNSSSLLATVYPSTATDKSVTWSSSDTAIATVSTTGTVKALSVGTCDITVTTVVGGKTATCKLTVTEGNGDSDTETDEDSYTNNIFVLGTGGNATLSRSSATAGQEVWIQVTADASYEVATVTATKADGSKQTLQRSNNGYYFFQPKTSVTVSVSFQELVPVWENPFTDVYVSDWYYPYVATMNQEGLMSGLEEGIFGPEAQCNRAMIVMILYLQEGKPQVSGNSLFWDVTSNAYYHDAAMWAAEQSVVGGVGDGMFAPGDFVTREQLATMLYAFSGVNTSDQSYLNAFTDADSISLWARDAVAWCVKEGIVGGRNDGTFAPQDTAYRAEVAVMLSKCFGL